jgi:hypothetical protein
LSDLRFGFGPCAIVQGRAGQQPSEQVPHQPGGSMITVSMKTLSPLALASARIACHWA